MLLSLVLIVVSVVLLIIGLLLDRPGPLDQYDLRDSTTYAAYTPVGPPYDEVNEIGDPSLWHGVPKEAPTLRTPSGLGVYEAKTSLGALEGGFVPFDASKPMRVCMLYRWNLDVREPISLLECSDSEQIVCAVLSVRLNTRGEYTVTWSVEDHHVQWVQPLFATDMEKTSAWVALELYLPCDGSVPAAYVNGYTCRLVSSDLDLLADRRAERSVLKVDILREASLYYADCSIQFVDDTSSHGWYWTYVKTVFLHPMLVYAHPDNVVLLPEGEHIPQDNTSPLSRMGDIQIETDFSSDKFRFEDGIVSWPTQGDHRLKVTPHSGSILLRSALVGTPTVFETAGIARQPDEAFSFSRPDDDVLTYGSRAVFSLDNKWACTKVCNTPGYKLTTLTDPSQASSFDEVTGVLGATVLQDSRRITVDTEWSSGETTRTVVNVPGRVPQRFDAKYYLRRGREVTLESFGVRDTLTVSQLPLGLVLRGNQITGTPYNLGVYHSVLHWQRHPNQDVEFMIGDAFEVDYHAKRVTLAGRPVDEGVLWRVDGVFDDLHHEVDHVQSPMDFTSCVASMPASCPGTKSLRFVLSPVGRQGLLGFEPVEYTVYYDKQRRYASEVYGLHETAYPKTQGPIRVWDADMNHVALNGFNSMPASRVLVDEQTGAVRLANHIAWHDPESDANCIDVTVDGETIRFQSGTTATVEARPTLKSRSQSLHVSRGDDIALDLKVLGLAGHAAEALPDGLEDVAGQLQGTVSETATPGRYMLTFPNDRRMEIHVAAVPMSRVTPSSTSPLLVASMYTSALGMGLLCALVFVG